MAVRPSLQGRAALAVALLIGFYLLALGIAGGLLYIPYAEWTYADRVTGRILVFCVASAFAILRGIVPRPDQFDPPGPIVTEREQPRLFAVIRGVSKATDQAMPEEVYLVPDVNAFVAQRGGVMGFGSRRVMGIGLPLLESLTVPQFRAVIAHEFGHYRGGDTKLGPWVYKTRASIIRTLQSLARHSSLLQKPFIWYGEAFSRLTLAISRQQEYVADELAARTTGAANLSQALTVLERSGKRVPGEPVVFRITSGDMTTVIEPFSVLDSLTAGTIEPAAWLETCHASGIANDDLGAYCRRASQVRAKAVSREVLGVRPHRSEVRIVILTAPHALS
jgi:Zn-dependent protease with chaperone function